MFPSSSQPFPTPAEPFPLVEREISASDIWLALLWELNGEWHNDAWVCSAFQDFCPYIYSPPAQRWQ
jgi:hypothetical protein